MNSGNDLRRQTLLSHVDSITTRLDETCRIAIMGRRASRALAEWVGHCSLTEAEFLLLWCLRAKVSDGLDQTTLAGALALSPAQISASVEKLRVRGLLCVRSAARDRRRNEWRLTPAGGEVFEQLISALARLRFDVKAEASENSSGDLREGVAA